MQNRKPTWWQLYVIVPAMLGLGLLERQFPLPGISPELAEVLIVVSAFSAMIAWVRINRSTIEDTEAQTDHALEHLQVTVYAPHAQADDDAPKPTTWEPDWTIAAANCLKTPDTTSAVGENKWSRN